MSQHLINEYRAELDRLRAVSGSTRESVLREAFKDLLKRWGKAHDLQFVAEHDILTKMMTRIYVDGALLHGLRVPFGYWEAKDENDDLDKEIEAKFRKGYPKDNIVFTDDATAVLWQDGAEVTHRYLYFDKALNSQSFRLHELYRYEANRSLVFSEPSYRTSFSAFAVDAPPEHHLLASKDAFSTAARFRYTKSGERVDNITDWALNKFVAEYGKKGVTKDAIFAYCYAILHDPIYREKYALNLKREFPRIPFYPDFAKWAAWGEALMAMHIGYEDVEPWPVKRIDTPDPKRAPGTHPKPVLKSHPDKGLVVVDADTQITGIPREAWDYRLGNRSAIDWVLDQHKEKTPRDPTIREKFNTYRFAEYKESMIELLAKVVRVSVDTVAITKAIQTLDRSGWDER